MKAPDIPPEITLINESSIWTKKQSKILQGMAQSDNYISHLELNGVETFIELANITRPFKKVIPLQEGANTISIIAGGFKRDTTKQRYHMDG